MREILFRGRTKGGKWWYGDAHTDFYGKVSIIIVPSYCWNTETIETQCAGYFGVEEKTVGQYSGLNDKNGKRIFEGDILRVVARNATAICKVVFRDGWFIGVTKDKCESEFRFFSDVEVIGNIHDNPKLMEVQNG